MQKVVPKELCAKHADFFLETTEYCCVLSSFLSGAGTKEKKGPVRHGMGGGDRRGGCPSMGATCKGSVQTVHVQVCQLRLCQMRMWRPNYCAADPPAADDRKNTVWRTWLGAANGRGFGILGGKRTMPRNKTSSVEGERLDLTVTMSRI